MYKFIENGKFFALTKKGYDATPEQVKREREENEVRR